MKNRISNFTQSTSNVRNDFSLKNVRKLKKIAASILNCSIFRKLNWNTTLNKVQDAIDFHCMFFLNSHSGQQSQQAKFKILFIIFYTGNSQFIGTRILSLALHAQTNLRIFGSSDRNSLQKQWVRHVCLITKLSSATHVYLIVCSVLSIYYCANFFK